MKPDSEILREEMVAIHDERLKLFQCGMTLLPALEIALYYVRKDVYEHLGLKPPQELPLGRFVIGTGILLIVASIFTMLTMGMSRRYQFLRKQYEEKCPNALPLPPRDKRAKPIVIFCYFIFPIMDLGIRFWIQFEYGVH